MRRRRPMSTGVSQAFELTAGRDVLVRLRSADRLLEARVHANDAGTETVIELRSPPPHLRRADFERGVDLEVVCDGDRYAAESVEVTSLDLPRGRLGVARLLGLPQVARRANFREPLDVPVHVEMRHHRMRCSTLELGGGGFSFECRGAVEPFEPGERLRFSIEVDEGPLTGTATVSWVTRRGHLLQVGAAFRSVDGRGFDLLYRVLYRLQARRRRR